MAYFKCTVELLIEVSDDGFGFAKDSAACDLVSEALTHNLKANKVINDWQYAKNSDIYHYPIELSKDEASNLFPEMQK